MALTHDVWYNLKPQMFNMEPRPEERRIQRETDRVEKKKKA
jgi:hypothetical protein